MINPSHHEYLYFQRQENCKKLRAKCMDHLLNEIDVLQSIWWSEVWIRKIQS
jgi:hypothetical protein